MQVFLVGGWGGGDMSYFASTKDISRLGRGGRGTRHALFSLYCYAISCFLSRFLLFFAHIKSYLDLF